MNETINQTAQAATQQSTELHWAVIVAIVLGVCAVFISLTWVQYKKEKELPRKKDDPLWRGMYLGFAAFVFFGILPAVFGLLEWDFIKEHLWVFGALTIGLMAYYYYVLVVKQKPKSPWELFQIAKDTVDQIYHSQDYKGGGAQQPMEYFKITGLDSKAAETGSGVAKIQILRKLDVGVTSEFFVDVHSVTGSVVHMHYDPPNELKHKVLGMESVSPRNTLMESFEETEKNESA